MTLTSVPVSGFILNFFSLLLVFAVDVLFIIGPSFLGSIYYRFFGGFFFPKNCSFSQRFVKRPWLAFPIMSFFSILKNLASNMMAC